MSRLTQSNTSIEIWLDQVNTILDYASVLYKDLFPEDMGVGGENKYFD
jgi:hypothetical protein